MARPEITSTLDAYLLTFWKLSQRGYPPTVRETGKAMGIRSTSTVNGAFDRLERAGFMASELGRPGTRRLTTKGLERVKELGGDVQPESPETRYSAEQVDKAIDAALDEPTRLLRQAGVLRADLLDVIKADVRAHLLQGA